MVDSRRALVLCITVSIGCGSGTKAPASAASKPAPTAPRDAVEELQAKLRVELARANEAGLAAADALSALGNAALMLNDAASAASAFRRALEIREQSLGPSHALVGISAASLAIAEYARGNDAAATRLYEHALEIFEKNLDANLDEFCETATQLSLVRRDDPASNETMLRHALGVVETKRGRPSAVYAGLASALYSVLAPRKSSDDVASQMAALGVRAGCVPKRACQENTVSSWNTEARHILSSAAKADALRSLELLRPRYRTCIDAARSDDPNTTGALQLTLAVGSSGAVSFVQFASVGLTERTVDCLAQIALGATFEPPADGHAVIVQPMSVEPRPKGP
jgi:tetratricopeptide (TPR) repeat protein